MQTYHYVLKSEVRRVRKLESNALIWREVCTEIEQTLGVRKSERLRGRVIANLQNARDNVETVEQWIKRFIFLPVLERQSTLCDKDVILIERVPLSLEVYNNKNQNNEEELQVPDEFQHLIRKISNTNNNSNFVHNNAPLHLVPLNLHFDEQMDELSRIKALTEQSSKRAALTVQPKGFIRKQEEPPSHYICHRCRVPGHWLRECPTRFDRSFDGPRVLSTNGIARSLLKPIVQIPPDATRDDTFYVDQEGRFFQLAENVKPTSRLVSERAFEYFAQQKEELQKEREKQQIKEKEEGEEGEEEGEESVDDW